MCTVKYQSDDMREKVRSFYINYAPVMDNALFKTLKPTVKRFSKRLRVVSAEPLHNYKKKNVQIHGWCAWFCELCLGLPLTNTDLLTEEQDRSRRKEDSLSVKGSNYGVLNEARP